jgi:ketosteroid isomerase-like protein
VSDRLDHVRGYYAALDTGDADVIATFFTDDAVHYYTRLGPHAGGRAIADHAAWAYAHLNGRWILEHAVEGEDEVVIEWTMTWRDPKSGARRLDRGTEWFRFRDGKIAEVRAYHHSGPRNRTGDLVGFDHAGRGHTTL